MLVSFLVEGKYNTMYRTITIFIPKLLLHTYHLCGNCGLRNLFSGFVVYIRLWFLYLHWTVVRNLSAVVICCKLYFFFVVINFWSNITNWRQGSRWSYTRQKMSVFISTVGEFQQEREDWTQYCDRLEYYFQANGITDENKKSLSFCSNITILISTINGVDNIREGVDIRCFTKSMFVLGRRWGSKQLLLRKKNCLVESKMIS